MKHSELTYQRALTLPLDAVHTDCVAVQLKSYRQKDAYFTVAVFTDFLEAKDFINLFPNIPHGKLRIIDCYGNCLYEDRMTFEESSAETGTLQWWLDQSKEIKEVVTGTNFIVAFRKPELPKFSLKRIANKLGSFIK
jgi:hypothetical protein